MCAERNIHWKSKLNAVESETILLASVHCIGSTKVQDKQLWMRERTNERPNKKKHRKQSTTLEKWIFLHFCLPLYKIHFPPPLSVCECVCACKCHRILQQSSIQSFHRLWKLRELVHLYCAVPLQWIWIKNKLNAWNERSKKSERKMETRKPKRKILWFISTILVKWKLSHNRQQVDLRV